jgi:hypothetical protein
MKACSMRIEAGTNDKAALERGNEKPNSFRQN